LKEHFFTAIWFFFGIVMLKFYSRRNRTVASAFIGMMSGGISLVALHFLGSYIGITVPVNLFNTAVSLVLGIPGTALIAGINLLF